MLVYCFISLVIRAPIVSVDRLKEVASLEKSRDLFGLRAKSGALRRTEHTRQVRCLTRGRDVEVSKGKEWTLVVIMSIALCSSGCWCRKNGQEGKDGDHACIYVCVYMYCMYVLNLILRAKKCEIPFLSRVNLLGQKWLVRGAASPRCWNLVALDGGHSLLI